MKREKPGLFNALNLATLQCGRPAALEAPDACADFQSCVDYFHGWLEWCALWYAFDGRNEKDSVETC